MASGPGWPRDPWDGWEARKNEDSTQQLRNVTASDKSQLMSSNVGPVSSLDFTEQNLLILGQIMSKRQVNQEYLE